MKFIFKEKFVFKIKGTEVNSATERTFTQTTHQIFSIQQEKKNPQTGNLKRHLKNSHI